MNRFEYPRPQLVRDAWQSLNGAWEFAYDDERRYSQPGDPIDWARTIEVPFAPEAAASGLGDQSFHTVCWYRRRFALAARAPRTRLHFGAVDYRARVWVNCMLVAEHEGGHTPFSADISDALLDGPEQTVVVQAEDDPADLAKPRGKQDWQLAPHSIWYPRTTGIWQSVWLEPLPSTYIAALRWTPVFDGFEIGCEVLAGGDVRGDLSVEVRVLHDGTLLAADRYLMVGQEANRKIVLSDPGIDDSRNDLLWSPESPTLLDAELTLYCGDQVIDRVRSYTAMRSVAINRDRFMLNGRPYPLRLVLDQGYWPDTLMTAPSDEALRRDVELARQMGFNGVRKHQKIEDPRYLYWADRLGLLVWEEMPSAYAFSARAITRLLKEWTEAIERDYSHPCLIVWVAFNESWGVPNLTAMQAHRNAVEALYHLTRMLDSTRPVIGNDGWEASATDILGIHDYEADPDRLRQRYQVNDEVRTLFDQRRPGGRILTLDGFPHRGQPIVLTEFGGVAYDPEAGERATWGYGRAADAASFIAHYRAMLKAVSETSMFSGFCYTQFADTFQETNGLLRADRSPKVPLEQIHAATRNAPL
ncbi:glycoside hydrolase family 2 protein [Duganella sp. HH101]|uniref:glycoside hydrolase family 2 protein n=1 Tax=Duganella sp. HH101 TaxID=1781066 RepID=UPI000893EF56|nr:glycoside hydrolase family 2 TIM barrel-domain containing protein [Duganella sp. HH101]OFA03700.1 beta-galactosidase [Duganella sp. HH101]